MKSRFEITRDEDGTVLIASYRPPVNAIRFDEWEEFGSIVQELDADPTAKAVVVHGRPGAHFCAGNDRREFEGLSAQTAAAGTGVVATGLRAVADSRLPFVAATHGAVLGSGMLLAAVCDMRVTTREAVWGLPERLAGTFGGYRVAREIWPMGEARLMALTGRTVTGERAHALGAAQLLADSADNSVELAVSLARDLAELATPGIDESRSFAVRSESLDLWSGHELELKLAVALLGASSDAASGEDLT